MNDWSLRTQDFGHLACLDLQRNYQTTTFRGTQWLRLFPRTSYPLKKNTLLCFETSGPINLTSRCYFPEEQNLRYKNSKNVRCPKSERCFWTSGMIVSLLSGIRERERRPNGKEWRLKCNNSHIKKIISHSINTQVQFVQYNQQDAPLSQIIYPCKMLYIFRTAFSSIIRSSKLHIRQQVYVKQLLLHFVPASSRQQQLFDIRLLPYVQF